MPAVPDYRGGTSHMNLQEDTIIQALRQERVDAELAYALLNNYNQGLYDHIRPFEVKDIPSIDGTSIIDMRGDIRIRLKVADVLANLEELSVSLSPSWLPPQEQGHFLFTRSALQELGIRLFPYVAYGVLNGGSATSYIDYKKNSSFDNGLFANAEKEFSRMASVSQGKSKGLSPAFLQPDGSIGPSFLELKLRSLMVKALHYEAATGLRNPNLFPFFQMTSVYNDEEMQKAFAEFPHQPLLEDLASYTGLHIGTPMTGVQPLIAAYTHSREGKPKRIFTNAYGIPGKILPLPGGHGQNFRALKSVYRSLFEEGIRFAYLGNVDNIGYTIDPVSLALLAVTGKQAGFDFAFKTPVDVKGGILVRDSRGALNCVDIGSAISREEVLSIEKTGKYILFNAATGLFNLPFLLKELDRIIEGLPVRFTDQEKDAGFYSQAEQMTWEIIGMLDDFLIFAIDKYERFLAAKLLIETLMTSGLCVRGETCSGGCEARYRDLSINLFRGLQSRLKNEYGMKLEKNRWVAKSVEELKADYT